MRKIIFTLMLLAMALTATAQQDTALPVVNWGLKAQANLTRYRIKNIPTYPHLTTAARPGAELGTYLNFNISRSFYVQFNLIGTYETFHVNFGNGHQAPMQSASLEVPIFALWRHPVGRGIFSAGGGPYTQFVVWGNLEGENPYQHVVTDPGTGDETIVTADNFSGVVLLVGYEWPCHLQLNATYHIGISDLLLFEHDTRDMYMRAHKVTLGLGWRF